MTLKDVEKLWSRLTRGVNIIIKGREPKIIDIILWTKSYVKIWLDLNPKHDKRIVYTTAAEFCHHAIRSFQLAEKYANETLNNDNELILQ